MSNVGCKNGTVSIYDTFFSVLIPSIIPIIANLTVTSLDILTIQMVDVEKQCNGSDCGVFAVSIAHDLCAGFDPGNVKYDHKNIRSHLATCLEDTSFHRFPILTNKRKNEGIKTSQNIELYCTCRLPEGDDEEWVACETCGKWFHKHCADIPDTAFCAEVSWECKDCTCRDIV